MLSPVVQSETTSHLRSHFPLYHKLFFLSFLFQTYLFWTWADLNALKGTEGGFAQYSCERGSIEGSWHVHSWKHFIFSDSQDTSKWIYIQILFLVVHSFPLESGDEETGIMQLWLLLTLWCGFFSWFSVQSAIELCHTSWNSQYVLRVCVCVVFVQLKLTCIWNREGWTWFSSEVEQLSSSYVPHRLTRMTSEIESSFVRFRFVEDCCLTSRLRFLCEM